MPRFDLDGCLRSIETHRITVAVVVPPIVLALAKHPAVDGYDLSSLVRIGCGAAPLGAALQQACADRIGCPVGQGYGMTEAVAAVALYDASAPPVPGSAGRLLPGIEARILDLASGADLGPDAAGELWVRGPSLMSGYLGNPAATAATIDADGWLHTGDIARIDGDGHLFVEDRLKELIKVKGFQVAPAELEAILRAHPAVADAAVIGVPDGRAGEVPKAVVVRAAEISGEQLIAHVADRVAPYKRLRGRVRRRDPHLALRQDPAATVGRTMTPSGSVVVCGGGMIGLALSMMLAHDGHRVTVLEADPAGAPTEPVQAWESWERRGIPQFRQPHTLLARFRRICDEELPGLTDRLLAAGCVRVDPLDALPRTLADRTGRPGDDAYVQITGRRPVIESAVAATAEDQPGVTVRRGVRVAGLLTGSAAVGGVAHVGGVRTTTGEKIVADLVVDATGRRTPSRGWLRDLGARPRRRRPSTAASSTTPATSPVPSSPGVAAPRSARSAASPCSPCPGTTTPGRSRCSA